MDQNKIHGIFFSSIAFQRRHAKSRKIDRKLLPYNSMRFNSSRKAVVRLHSLIVDFDTQIYT